MRPLPRLLAITDDAICADQNFSIHAAAVLSAGSGVAIVVRAPAASLDQRRQYLERVHALARTTEASLIAFNAPVLGKLGHGVQLEESHPDPAEARQTMGPGWVGVTVDSVLEADRAIQAGADYLVARQTSRSMVPEHPSTSGLLPLISIIELGIPVFANGDVSSDELEALKEAGVWGITTSAVFRAVDPARATAELLARWIDRPDPDPMSQRVIE